MKKIAFLTGTRADFGKLKSLIEVCIQSPEFEVHIFATGMHMHAKYGSTKDEIVKCGYPNIYGFINYTSEKSMDLTLSKTIEGFSNYVREFGFDLIVIHGDRPEAMAGAIVGSLNNILVAHVEGGEVSGTIDEVIRHAVSKLSHVHFVANDQAKMRLVQMGERPDSIFIIGSPDIDIMLSNKLPKLETVKTYYHIPFSDFGVLMYHPVTTESEFTFSQAKNVVDACIRSEKNYVVVYPNNDMGSNDIFRAYEKFNSYKDRFRVFPSLRFEYFLVLLKNAQFIIGNSSAGVREAPYYGVPTVNIGTRQNNRTNSKKIINCGYEVDDINKAILKATQTKLSLENFFGIGNSDQQFIQTLKTEVFWTIPKQKQFIDLNA